jgi:hypothetical protein
MTYQGHELLVEFRSGPAPAEFHKIPGKQVGQEQRHAPENEIAPPQDGQISDTGRGVVMSLSRGGENPG